MRELNIEEQEELNHHLAPTKAAKEMKQKGLKNLKSTWEEKLLHFQCPLRGNNADVDQKKTHQWLHSLGLKAEAEGFILAAKDQSLLTRNHQAKVMKHGENPRCGKCTQYEETIDHLI